jgi:hypothetical protein
VRLCLCGTGPLTGPLLKMLLMTTKELFAFHLYYARAHLQHGSNVLEKDRII